MAGRRTSAGAALLVATSLVVPGFDAKTAAALGLGLALAAAITARGVYRRQPGARAMLAWLRLVRAQLLLSTCSALYMLVNATSRADTPAHTVHTRHTHDGRSLPPPTPASEARPHEHR